MNSPSIIIGIVISTLLGALFHIWRGGGPGKLALYLLLGWIGFWLGHLLANRWNLAFADLGALHLGPALIFEVIFLSIGHWLSLVEPEKRPKRRY